jgi:hypothetical protein
MVADAPIRTGVQRMPLARGSDMHSQKRLGKPVLQSL